MKDSRFTELVNLYIDRQITAAEATELEAELQGSPRRRAVYRQYCRLHSATKQVYDSFSAQADQPQSATTIGQAAIAKFDGRPRSNWIHYAGGLAVAACLAIVYVRYDSGRQPSGENLAPTELTPAVQVAAVPAVAAPVASPVSLRNPPSTQPDYPALLATLRQEEPRTFANAEIQSNRQPSLFDDGVFEMRPVPPPAGQRTFRSRQTPAEQAEFTAFQFQR